MASNGLRQAAVGIWLLLQGCAGEPPVVSAAASAKAVAQLVPEAAAPDSAGGYDPEFEQRRLLREPPDNALSEAVQQSLQGDLERRRQDQERWRAEQRSLELQRREQIERSRQQIHERYRLELQQELDVRRGVLPPGPVLRPCPSTGCR
ncbi:MAG TPA: hypothetical protein VNN09_05335 [Candidatus Competibacteraceae bacterium]|nr:hypothetical protein [Candidatus Competibacteraceae bacterium]